ncbi:hypothetical protein AKO1_013781 [Acrasis kona]|uniref:Uncharacterized protein n=1 Tax=Acrasis kona TaxID=1008807 RepID=A0AAW2ZIP1_9EUKA
MSVLRQQFVMGRTSATSQILSEPDSIVKPNWKRMNEEHLGPTPVIDSQVPLRHVAKVRTGYNYTMFITTDGDLWGVGENYSGQLFSNVISSKPIKCDIPELAKNCYKIACGYDHTLVVLRSGEVWGSGSNSSGQLGGRRGKLHVVDDSNREPHIVSCAAKGQHSVLLTEEGNVYTSGWNHFGQTNPNNRTSSDRFEMVRELPIAAKIESGYYATFILTYDHCVYVCGGDITNSFRPMLIDHPELHKNVRKIASGQQHVAYLTMSGDVYMSAAEEAGFKKLDLTSLHLFGAVRSVYCGYKQTLLITNKNEVIVFGLNRSGQIDPDGCDGIIEEPKQIQVDVTKPSRLRIKASLSANHTVIYTVPVNELLFIQQTLHSSLLSQKIVDVSIITTVTLKKAII